MGSILAMSLELKKAQDDEYLYQELQFPEGDSAFFITANHKESLCEGRWFAVRFSGKINSLHQ